ncbi:hypothetical protein NQ318_010788 [Aromia moschata]|uniref:Secreted protein n=1 Tax=Aromia moschata TaxID=1265417 RepID=A0AAV8XDL6_9CUCU|nr:hypothetical protein NQ318_010788 [Aromia moschata]
MATAFLKVFMTILATTGTYYVDKSCDLDEIQNCNTSQTSKSFIEGAKPKKGKDLQNIVTQMVRKWATEIGGNLTDLSRTMTREDEVEKT